MRLGIDLIFGCVLATTPAAAQSTTNELLSHCETFLRNYKALGPDTFQLAREPEAYQCYGYMSAVTQFAYLHLRDTTTGAERKPFEFVCLPPHVQVAQLIRIFVNFSQQHPERLNEQPPLVLLTALWQAFPCNK